MLRALRDASHHDTSVIVSNVTKEVLFYIFLLPTGKAKFTEIKAQAQGDSASLQQHLDLKAGACDSNLSV